MNSISQKTKSAHRRLANAFQSLFFSKKLIIYERKLYDYHNLSFSQEGEDMILARIFSSHRHGFYIDVGAHHPQRFSNTYLFYLKGWRGINIDAMPGSMRAFEELRADDINVEAAISDNSELLTYYMFNEPALNGFSDQLTAARDGSQNHKVIEKRLIKTRRLSEVLDEHLPQDQKIDFLSIDVEGLDYQVLASNDWSKYRPEVILIEELFTSLETLPYQSKAYCLLRDHDYKLFAKTFNTSFYKLVSS